jgi:hypothetical protein
MSLPSRGTNHPVFPADTKDQQLIATQLMHKVYIETWRRLLTDLAAATFLATALFSLVITAVVAQATVILGSEDYQAVTQAFV